MDFSKIFQYKVDLLKKYEILDICIIFLVFLFYVTILWNTSVAKNCYTLLALISLYLLTTRQLTAKLFRLEKYFLWSIAAGFIWVILTYFINDMPKGGGSWILNRQFRLLLIIPIYLMFRNRPLPGNVWWFIIGFAAIVVGNVALSEVRWEEGWPVGRAQGDTNAIFFGYISLCLSFLVFIGIKPFYSSNNYKIVFWFVSVCSGFFALVVSGSRSAWIAIPISLIFVSWYLVRNVSIYKKILIIISLLLIPVAMFQFPYTQVKYNATVKGTSDYLQSKSIFDPVRLTSEGERLDAWRVMLLTIKNNLIFGIGIGGFDAEMQRYIDKKSIHPQLGKLPHSHNQYIEASLYSGILGLILNLSILILPGAIFLFHINNNSYSLIPYAISGLLVVTAYLLFGLVDLTLTRKIPIIFYGLTISILLSIMYQEDKNTDSNPL